MDHDLRRKKLEELVPRVAEGMRLNQEHRPVEAKEILRECWNEAKAWHCTSAFVAWQLAISFDLLGDPSGALRFIAEALRLDPFPAPFRASAEIIVANARLKLAQLDTGDPRIRGIVRGLAKVGAANPDDHLLLARHFSEHGREEEALGATDAALKLDPEYVLAQMARAAIRIGMRWSLPSKNEAAVALAQVLGNGIVGEA